MDTKWKKRKAKISFICYFLGLSLLLGSVLNIVWLWKGEGFSWQKLGAVFEHELFAEGKEDYQKKDSFREEICSRLEIFLTMATGGAFSGTYVGNRFVPNRVNVTLQVTEDGSGFVWEKGTDAYIIGNITQIRPEESTVGEITDENGVAYYDFGVWSQDAWLYLDNWEEYLEKGDYTSGEKAAFRDQRKRLEEEWKEAAQEYHETIRGDKNLLYGIYNEGNLLYTNMSGNQAQDLLNWDRLDADLGAGRIPALPEGYNFLLCFAGGKVHIYKDGLELNVYGDGYYREESDWFVPGYTNFPVDEAYDQVRIYMAAAKEPVLYTEGRYGGNYYQLECPFYWMSLESTTFPAEMQFFLILLGISLLFLLAALVMKKSRKAAARAIASVTGKLWIEIKVLFWIDILGLFFGWMHLANQIAYGYNYSWKDKNVTVLALILLFWLLYLSWNELRYLGKEVFLQGITARLIRLFSVRELKLPLARRLMRRNFRLFLCAAVPGGLMSVLLVVFMTVLSNQGGSSYYDRIWQRYLWLGILLFLLVFLLVLVICCYMARKNRQTVLDLEKLTDRISEIRDGKYEPDPAGEAGGKVREAAPPSDHDLCQAMTELEDIRSGIETAIEEQMKSERMKVELIANVSHDLKTPLTSIISYVQILKQEENLPEHVKDYVKILDEKSQRLKNMVQDVFTISKAASRELPVNIEVLDFGKLIRQTLADMDEEIQTSVVNFRTNLPAEPVMIRADGQRMYRVFQNLFQNAIKYSLEGSRVHVTLRQDGNLAVASVKNTSRMELKADVNYAERFTRGDESRTDGGSGLGLSIAQSFTEACGGQFLLETIADLFVVTVSFPVVEEER